jgi:hypothetical protein
MIELLELPPGWNSYNARPISKQNVNFALSLLGRIMLPNTPSPDVVPTVRGGVQLEWHIHGIDMEISVLSPDDVRFLAEDFRGNFAEGPLDATVVSSWIGRLTR